MHEKIFFTKLHEEKKKLEETIINGHIQSFDNYRFLVGQIKGLEGAIKIYKNIFIGDIDE